MKKIILSLFIIAAFTSVNAQTPPAPEPPLDDYIGKYVFPDGSVVPDVDVLVQDGALIMTSTGGTTVLTQLGVDSFQIVEFGGTAVFRRGTDKKVSSVHIEAGGYILDGTKVPKSELALREYYLPANTELLLVRN